MYCANCGNIIDSGKSFCTKCGTRIDINITEAASPLSNPIINNINKPSDEKNECVYDCHQGIDSGFDKSAFWMRRFVANIIDLTILGAIDFIFVFLYANISVLLGIQNKEQFKEINAVFLIGIFLLKDSYKGQSIGKAIMSLQVIKDNTNKPIGFLESISRNIGILPTVTILIAFFQMGNAKRVGDGYSGTSVRSVYSYKTIAILISIIIAIVSLCLFVLSYGPGKTWLPHAQYLGANNDGMQENEKINPPIYNVFTSTEDKFTIDVPTWAGKFEKETDYIKIPRIGLTKQTTYKAGNDYVVLMVAHSEFKIPKGLPVNVEKGLDGCIDYPVFRANGRDVKKTRKMMCNMNAISATYTVSKNGVVFYNRIDCIGNGNSQYMLMALTINTEDLKKPEVEHFFESLKCI